MPRHWIDELADNLYEKLLERRKEVYVFNGGLSVSGLQHVGRLRGEIIIPEVIRRILSKKGLKIKQYITLYTQDAWKGKKAQLNAFPNPKEAEKYKGWPLINVPDPMGCHKNWVEHYWEDFGPYLKEFTDGEIEVVTTTDLYRGKLLEFTLKTLEIREKVRKTINKYRGRKPYPENWIPFEPICSKCGRIDSTEALEIIDHDKVKYRCKNCGYMGVSDLSNGKLNWRIEWVGVWWSLGVDFEPYGKDHATPGGSRDSCADLAVNVYGIKPPEGIPYEWVAMRTKDKKVLDMTSSGFIGFTPKEWLEVAHPHIYRFIVLRTSPMKKIVLSLYEIPQYYSQYYKAERIYYGLEKAKNEEEEVLLKRSYELSYPRGEPPETPPEQVSYTHLAILSQILPSQLWRTEGIKRLINTKIIPENPSKYGLQRILETLEKAHVWTEKYAPENMKFKLLPEPKPEIIKTIPEKHRIILRKMKKLLEQIEEWNDENIKNAMIAATKDLTMNERKRLYEDFYKLIIGKPSGPRAAPLLALLGKENSLKYFEYI
ncbi:lysine--tRNA ligase [Staphylothermus hellenicus]|uniref:Lysine--tRNA ligase n=1 Tax=Staphylothermus hellenicus (strain DSM 12710 / JCM 10830 / BK20S6-10-b1 / P8) TaxID=591019 RepID=D7DCD6_STAHD|nr:lysine--tRNA ligase [Staphylothermus hellenicus]ADI31833.1 lysyl-tRNA synthetase [Staphylothermus hellenicus DSM 12710]